ncbi:MAG: Ig-like domain-containing protein, partial [Shewanella sp.]
MYSIDVTDSVTWHLDNPSIATVSEGVLTGDAAGETILTATKDGVTSNNVSVTVTLVQASSIEITPSPVKMPIGPALQLNAIAGYSDGSSYDVTNTVKWKLADTNIATVTQDGKLTGLAVGETTLTATKNGVTSNPVTVTISDAVITAVQLTPSPANVVKAQTLPLRVIATYSDNSTFDLIDEGNLEWSIGDTAIAEVTKGQLQGLQEGTTTVTVTKDGVTSNKATVNVTPAVITAISLYSPDVIIPNGLTKQLQVTAHYSDNSNSDITERVTWSVDESIAVVSPEGVFTGVGVGKTLLRAFLDGVSSNIIEFTITPAELIAITMEPSSAITLPQGLSQQLTAIGKYTDGSTHDLTDRVQWAATSDVFIDDKGKLTAKSEGQTPVSARMQEIESNQLSVTVTPAELVSLELSPVSVRKAETEELKLIGTYTDGQKRDHTKDDNTSWAVANTSLATVEKGLVTGVAEGETTVTATVNGITATANLTVTEAVLVSIEIQPVPDVITGRPVQLEVHGTYSDGSTTQDLASVVTWRPSDYYMVSPTGELLATMPLLNAKVVATIGELSDTKDFRIRRVSGMHLNRGGVDRHDSDALIAAIGYPAIKFSVYERYEDGGAGTLIQDLSRVKWEASDPLVNVEALDDGSFAVSLGSSDEVTFLKTDKITLTATLNDFGRKIVFPVTIYPVCD